ncbi:MAG: thioredoxin family protein [Hyphomicrobiales bacterium]|nr:thioredoxin family protein [Hyphomicrobiales bacterium]MDE2115312.1 thioredoxin family protein [Hyphomicrobiales bacterium]
MTLATGALGAAALLAPATLAAAVGPVPFNRAAFLAAQKADKPILVQIHADWCPTCAAQKPILSKLEAQADYADFVVFNVDFDKQKAIVRSFKANMQSTLIVYKGNKEVARSVGSTDPMTIEDLFKQAI